MTLYLYPAGMPNSSHTYTSCASASVSEAARCPEARACNSSTDLQPCVYAGAPLLRLPLAPAFATAGLPPPSGPTGIPTANDLCLVTRGSQATGPFLPNPSPNAHIPNLSRPPYTSHPALHTTPTLPHTPHTSPLVAQAAERAFVRARGSVLAVTLLGDAAVRHCYRGHMGGGGTKPATPALHAHLQP